MKEKKILSCPKCKSQNVKRTRGVYWCADCGCEWRLTEEEPLKMQSLTIKNSTAEFLIFQAQSQANGVEAHTLPENTVSLMTVYRPQLSSRVLGSIKPRWS